MGMTLIGKEVIASLLSAVTPFANYDSANAHLAVGDNNIAFADTQTDLQAATNKLRKPMDTTFPTRAGREITWRSTFTGAEANWAWLENGIFNALTGGQMLARDVEDLGTKATGAVWVYTKKGTIT